MINNSSKSIRGLSRIWSTIEGKALKDNQEFDECNWILTRVFFQVEKLSVKVAPNSATAAKKAKWQSKYTCQKWKQVILAMHKHWINKKKREWGKQGQCFFKLNFVILLKWPSYIRVFCQIWPHSKHERRKIFKHPFMLYAVVVISGNFLEIFRNFFK